MDATEGSPGAGLPRPSEFDFMFTDEGWALLSEERRRSIIGVLDQDREEKTRLQERRQSRSRKDRRKDPRPGKQIHPSKSLDPNLSRDVRDDSDNLLWIRQHRVLNHSDSVPVLPPMRYTSCQLLGNGCSHYPHPMLQFLAVFVQFYRNALNVMRGNTHIHVYGLLAVRDSLDSSRNYIFQRSRENAQAIDVNGGFLSLSYPARGISAIGCLIEIDIKIKGKEVDKDLSIIDGSVKAFGQFDSTTANHVDNVNGGFNVLMRAKTVRGKAVYSFISECCDDDSFIASPGKHNKKFVAAVSIGDTLCIDFMEKKREALSFVSSKHGNEQLPYRFSNGALVFVKVFWSTIVDGWPLGL
ncbi:unnamed protein product [Triticum turgidum subsp. durum]|uniref:DUF6598 domain-containing protein n=1 Tax=Triticum turgidum subsp. durum TaxID=4567 RepID=A0A9R0RZF7_TRITD|nr:unnamed protein product [Triticum turgidum subsp. durum]